MEQKGRTMIERIIVILMGIFLTTVMPYLKLTGLHMELDRCFIMQIVGLILIAMGALGSKRE